MMNFNRPLILASNSPRRQELLKSAGFDFKVFVKAVDETYPTLPPTQVAAFLAQKKSEAYIDELDNEVIITADTVVKLGDAILGKPNDENEAKDMLRSLSDTHHEVITGVCIANKENTVVVDDTTTVHFRALKEEEIDFYVEHYRPYDKAGAYGIQEWIGMIGITKIIGSYFNVMGLPIHKIYEVLSNFLRR